MDIQYKMIGGDGREYGPASLEEMKSWIREGRIAGTTLIWRSDMETWTPASQFVEFQPELGPSRGNPPALPDARAVGFIPRLAAYMMDQFLLGFIISFIWGVFLSHIPGWEMPNVDFSKAGSVSDILANFQVFREFSNHILMIFLPALFLYEVILNGSVGATVGKLVIGARIVRLDGSPINYRMAASRFLCERLSDMFLCYVGHFFVVFRGDKRALHDLVAGTRVIFKR